LMEKREFCFSWSRTCLFRNEHFSFLILTPVPFKTISRYNQA
jgi:hypothetical protein